MSQTVEKDVQGIQNLAVMASPCGVLSAGSTAKYPCHACLLRACTSQLVNSFLLGWTLPSQTLMCISHAKR